MMKKKRSAALLQWLAMLLWTALLLSGCGSAASSDSAAVVAETAAAAAMGGMALKNEMGFEASSGDMAESGLTDQTTLAAPQAAGRKLIRTVRMSVETDSFDTLLSELQERITALSGYIEQSDVSGKSMLRQNSSFRRYASITARIPSTSLEQFINEVENRGNVTSRSESTEDVTLRYSDLESRKKSLTIEQERIWALLEKADTLEAVIALEERLSEIRYELESMESQLRLYDNQVDYSTVYLDISEVTIYTPTEPESIGTRIRNGFAKNVERMTEFTENLFVDILSTSPVWLPLLLLGCLLGYLISRRRKGHSGSLLSRLRGKKRNKAPTEDGSGGNNG